MPKKFQMLYTLVMDEPFNCPFCGQENSLFVDISAGNRQRVLTDCETCCRPLVVDIRLSGDELLSIDASSENE